MNTVIFDVDGTLVDTNYHHAIAWFRAFQQHGVTVPVWRIHRALGMGGDRLVEQVAGADVERELGDAVRDEWKRRYEPMLEEVRGFEGARDVVAEAGSGGRRVALASSGQSDHVKHYLGLLNLNDLADDWTSAADVDDTKPAPDLLYTALDRLGGGAAVLIGDSIWDCEAAANAGLPCVALLTGGFAELELRDTGAAAVYPDLRALRAALPTLPFATPK